MALFAYFVITMVISLVLSASAAKGQAKTQKPNLELDDDSFPMATEDKNWQLIYGTTVTEGLNCTWYGDYSTFPIIEKVKQKGLFKNKKVKQTVAYGFRAGFKLALGYGELILRDLRFENKIFYVNENNTEGDIDISIKSKYIYKSDTYDGYEGELIVDNNNFFGDYKREGGIGGDILFNSGTENQQIPSYLLDKIPEDKIYRNKHQSFVLFKNFYYGNNKQLKKTSALVSRYPKSDGLLIDYLTVMPDLSCNPISIIFDLITNPVLNEMGFKLKDGSELLSRELKHRQGIIDNIDLDSFIEAQMVMISEGFGLSMCITNDRAIDDIISDVCEEVEAHIYSNIESRKISIRISRKDYDLNDLIVLNEDDVISVNNITTQSTSDSINQMKLTYSDASDNYNKRVIVFNNEASYEDNKNTVSKSISKLNVNNFQLAERLLMRDFKPLSQKIIKADISIKKSSFRVIAGDVIMVDLPRYKIDKKPMRVLTVNYGNSNSSIIKLNLMQDLFGDMSISNVSKIQDSSDEDILEDDIPSVNLNIDTIDAPFYYSTLGENLLNLDNINKGENILLVSPTDSVTISSKLYTTNENYEYSNISSFDNQFTPNSILSSNIGRYDDEISIGNIYIGNDDISESDIRNGENIAIIKSPDSSKQEFISFRSYDELSGKLTGVKRGLIDTIPENHTKDSIIHFISEGFFSNDSYLVPYMYFPTPRIRTKNKSINFEYKDPQNVISGKDTLFSEYRVIDKIIPSNFKINNINFDDIVNIPLTNTLKLTFSERKRTKDYIQFYNDKTIPTEDSLLNIKINGDNYTTNDYEFIYEIPDGETTFNIEVTAGDIDEKPLLNKRSKFKYKVRVNLI